MEIKIDETLLQHVDYTHEFFPMETTVHDSSDLSPSSPVPDHWHSDFEFNICLKGQLISCVSNERYVVNPGEFIFFNSNVIHHGEKSPAPAYTCRTLLISPSIYNFNGAFYKKYAVSVMRHLPKVIVFNSRSPLHSDLYRLLMQIFDIAYKADNGYELQTMPLLYEVLQKLYSLASDVSFYNNSNGVNSQEYKYMKLMLDHIHANYSEQIGISDICKAANISKSYANKLFNQFTGGSPGEYITDHRLNKACDHLLNGSTVSEAALSSGFNDPAYFSKLFKKHKGMSPKEFVRTYSSDK